MRKILAGKVSPKPEVRVVDEAQTTAVIDGEGGRGFIPTHRAAELAIAKAVEVGVGAATTRNHFHFGAAGIYSRMGLGARLYRPGLKVFFKSLEIGAVRHVLGGVLAGIWRLTGASKRTAL